MDRLSTEDSGWFPVPAPLSLLLTPSPLRGAPPTQSKGLDCAISVLSGILLRTDSCFPSDSDVKLFPWPLTQLLWAAALSLPPARPLLFPSPKLLSGQKLSSSETWRRKLGPRGSHSPRGALGGLGAAFQYSEVGHCDSHGKACSCAEKSPAGPHPQVGTRGRHGEGRRRTSCCGSTTSRLVEGRDQGLTVPICCVCMCVHMCVHFSTFSLAYLALSLILLPFPSPFPL